MKLTGQIERIRRRPDDRGELRAAGQAVGASLARGDIADAGDLLAALAAATPDDLDSFSGGYLMALRDLLGVYDAALTDSRDDEQGAALLARPTAFGALEALASGPQRGVDLATQLGRDKSVVGRALARLRELGLIEESPATDARERPFRITPRGRAALRSAGTNTRPPRADAETGATVRVAARRRARRKSPTPRK